jgi:hypothetical protein
VKKLPPLSINHVFGQKQPLNGVIIYTDDVGLSIRQNGGKYIEPSKGAAYNK